MTRPNELQRLKLAFSLHVCKLIVDADETLHYDEYKWLGRVFPRHLLRSAGFMNEAGTLLGELEIMQEAALQTLPKRLDTEEKEEFLQFFYEAAMADEELEQREILVLQEATRFLNIPPERLTQLLASWSVKRKLGLSIPPPD